jgi:hypothetical protein
VFTRLTTFSWERRVPKQGPKHNEAIRYLKRIGIPALAAGHEDMSNALINYVKLFVRGLTAMNFVRNSDLFWMEGLNQQSFQQPGASDLLLPAAHETYETLTAGHADHGIDPNEVFDKAM